MIDTLRDPEAEVRWRAAFALGRIGDIRAIEPLIKVLDDPKADVRWGAAFALGEIGDPGALTELERITREDSGQTRWGDRVADKAWEAIEKIRQRPSSTPTDVETY